MDDLAGLIDLVSRGCERGVGWPDEALSMAGRARLWNAARLVQAAVLAGVPGDVLEAGVWRGGCSIVMRAALGRGTDRTVWVVDSFNGLPPSSDPHDTVDFSGIPVLSVSMAEVNDNFRRLGWADGQVRFVEGWFRDTLPALDVRLAVLRLDGDLFTSTTDTLEALYDKVSVGGYVIVDDYHALDCCRQATDEFRSRRKVRGPMTRIDWAGAYWQKPGA